MFALFSQWFSHSLKAKLITIAPVKICLIHIVSNCALSEYVLLTAILFAASSSGDVGESLHVRTHHQQKVCTRHHRGYR